MSDRERLNTFLVEQQYMTLAVTLDDGTPWATPLRIKHREGNVFEWDSMLSTEHSKAIAVRPNIAISMYTPKTDSTIQFGVYATAQAKLLEDTEGLGRYQATVTKAWINDATFVKREVSLG